MQPKVFKLTYETINTQAMATAKVAVKKPKADNIFTSIISNKSKFESVTQTGNKKEEPVQPTKPVWRLPTEQGYITQYERYGHTSLDITSSRGTNERIYPVADGVITSIFYDNYGAKIVTVNHYIDGKYYVLSMISQDLDDIKEHELLGYEKSELVKRLPPETFGR